MTVFYLYQGATRFALAPGYSLNVANRRNEFGIRLALGAQTANVLRMILAQALRSE